jgi:DNA-binding NarL/FixJ family response regulator
MSLTDANNHSNIVSSNVSSKFAIGGHMNKENNAQKLYRRGMSKYEIAKKTGVSWNTVHFWVLGIYDPKPEHDKKLKGLLNA